MRGTAACLLILGVLGGAAANDDTSVRCFVVDTADDTVDANPGDGVCADANGNCSLRAAVQEANASAVPTQIVLQPDVEYHLVLAGAGEDAAATGDLDVTGDVTVVGGARVERVLRRSVLVDATSGAVINGEFLDRVFDVHQSGSLTLEGVGLFGGTVTDANGGHIRSCGSVRLERSSVVAGRALGDGASGGGVFNDGGTFMTSLTEFLNCEAADGGGAVASRGGVTTIDRCRLVGHVAEEGGAVRVDGIGSLDIRRSTFDVNIAQRRGGAIWNSSEGSIIDDCLFVENRARGTTSDAGGGGIFNAGGSLTITDSTIVDNCALGVNNAPQWGGGIYHADGFLSLERSQVTFNQASSAGGGVAVAGGTASLLRTRLARNGAASFEFEEPPPGVGGGGGLYVTGDAVVTVDRCRILRNTAETNGGGGIYSEGNVTVTRSTIVRNTMSRFGDLGGRGGAGIYNAGGTLRIEDSRIARNKAGGVFDPEKIFPPGDGGVLDRDGGGVLNVGGTVVIERSRIVGNRAGGTDSAGGGVLSDGGSLTLRGSLLSRNGSGRAGGGVAVEGGGEATLERVTATGNSAGRNPGDGGGLYVAGAATVTVTGGRYLRNRARNSGGGLWNSATGTIVVTRARIGRNRAPTGRNLFNAGGTFTVDDEDVPVGGE